MTESSGISEAGSIGNPQDSRVLSRIEGVRPCLHCGHDLHGQSIRKEESLGILVAFCPECGQAASLVEHPSLGIWSRRLGIFALICLIGMVLGLLVASVMSLFGIMLGLTTELYGPSRSALSGMIDGGWQIENTWWRDNAIEARRVMWSAVDMTDPEFLGIGILFLPICFVLGVIWSGILLGLRRRYLPLAGIAMCLLGWLIMWPFLIADGTFNASPQMSIYQVTMRELIPLLSLLVMGVLMIPLILGLSFGRPILRSLVKVVLPPRSRRLLRPLWDTDGIPLSVPLD